MNNLFIRNKKLIIPIVFLLLSSSLIFSLLVFEAAGDCFNKRCFSSESNQAGVNQADANQIGQRFISPYAGVDWSKISYYSGNFHTHTNLSDGLPAPDEVVEHYYRNSFAILAITDHDTLGGYKTSWPWPEIGVELSGENKILAVEGSEITEFDHVGSFFSDYSGPTSSMSEALEKIGLKKGLAIIFHPGRYSEPLEFYLDLYGRFPHLIGMEVFNRNNLYPQDIDLWDALSDKIMPARSVWGFAGDDMHNISEDFGFNRNIFPLEKLTLENLRSAMENGAFFFFRPAVAGGLPTSYLKSIRTEGDGIKLEVVGDYQKIEWFGYNPETGKTELVGSSDNIKISDLPEYLNFVRFVITNESGRLYSQPFKVRRPVN